ncbi:MAG: hypothetical protein NVS3B12_27150 [Acidimicrobiales bacterium]
MILPLMATLAFGIMDLGRVFTVHESLVNAARESADFVASHPGQEHSYTGTACVDPANADWRGHNEGRVSTNYTFTYSTDAASCITDPTLLPAGLAAGQPLRVRATTTVRALTPLFPSNIIVAASTCISIAGGKPSSTACP